MSSINHAHPHTHPSPPHVKKTAVKPLRPAASSKNALAPKITIKGAKASKRAKGAEKEVFEDDDDDEDDYMATSFLQFCAMCEKQIVVPNSSILYCSESCRRRDGTAVPSIRSYISALPIRPKVPSIYADIMDPHGSQFPDYVPQLQPTPRTIPDGRIPAKFHDGKSDLDPTEWKPSEPKPITEGKSPTKSSSSGGEGTPKLTHRPSSEAASFLSKFHSRNPSESLTSKRNRPTVGHGRTTLSSRSIPTPGLSHTPTASTSSEESLILSGTPYEFVARPAFSMPAGNAPSTKSVAAVGNRGGDNMTYEKKHVGTSLGSAASGSLKKLLGGSAAAGGEM